MPFLVLLPLVGRRYQVAFHQLSWDMELGSQALAELSLLARGSSLGRSRLLCGCGSRKDSGHIREELSQTDEKDRCQCVTAGQIHAALNESAPAAPGCGLEGTPCPGTRPRSPAGVVRCNLFTPRPAPVRAGEAHMHAHVGRVGRGAEEGRGRHCLCPCPHGACVASEGFKGHQGLW